MTDFLTRAIEDKVDFTAVVISDIHHRAADATYIANYPNFITPVLAKAALYGICFNAGDTGDSGTGVSACTGMRDAIQAVATYYNCRGNHDYFLSNADLGLSANYYSADIGDNWRLIVLNAIENSINPPYTWGATQITWLTAQLNTAVTDGKYVVIMNHLPILATAATSYYVGVGSGTQSQWFSGGASHTMQELNQIHNLLVLYPCVKAWIHGHEHTQDVTEHLGIKHINLGAAAGNWWNAANSNKVATFYRPNYSTITFNKDGTLSHQYFIY